MLVTESRPRNLRWVHAGPLLYGDWGTSRLYVLGLAFLYTGHASVIYLAAIGLLMLAVSWAYTIVCRCFPDGGGVYTAARQLSPTLAVIGSTLLLSGYIMTAAISVIEAFHYFGISGSLLLPLSVLSLVLIGGLNWFGAKSAGRFALVVAFGALAVSAVMAVLCMPDFARGVRTISFDYFRETPAFDVWANFTKICLALAGVEAVANMTGLMRKPVGREAKRTIWPVTTEVVGLNMVFGLALTGLVGFTVAGVAMADIETPDSIALKEQRAAVIEMLPADIAAGQREGASIRLDDDELARLDEAALAGLEGLERYEAEVDQYTNASMKVIARVSGERVFGEQGGFVFSKIAGVVFGLLLLSATNTAVMAMVSVLYSMAQDGELPRRLSRLNYSGVPMAGLVVAVAIPVAVIAVEQDVATLAKLYVLGVCGAITTSVFCVAYNRKLEMSRLSRGGLWALAAFLFCISATIAVTEPVSSAFSGGLVAAALGMRAVLRRRRARVVEPIAEPASGWLREVEGAMPTIDPERPRIMLAARGRYQAEFAVDMARQRRATLFVIFVRTIRVLDYRPHAAPNVRDDPDAQEALGSVVLLAKANGVPVVPIYAVAPDIASEILDYTVTYGCQTLILGKSRRSVFRRRLEGDVVARVSESLPVEVALVQRSAEAPHRSDDLRVPVSAAASAGGGEGAGGEGASEVEGGAGGGAEGAGPGGAGPGGAGLDDVRS